MSRTAAVEAGLAVLGAGGVGPGWWFEGAGLNWGTREVVGPA